MARVYAVMYHYVRDLRSSRYPEIKGLDLSLFRRQIDFMKDRFDFITLDELLDSVTLSKKSRDCVLLTFDDGYIDHYTNVFPILIENKIQGVFSVPGKIIKEKKVLDVNKIHFILANASIDKVKESVFQKLNYYRGTEFEIQSNQELYEKLAVANRFDSKDTIFVKRLLQTELDERLRNLITNELFKEYVSSREEAFADELYMSLDQIKLMKRYGMEFAIHGYDHYWMNRLKQEELSQDIRKALEVFEGIIDSNSWTCCYPYGSYSDNVIEIIKTMGAVAGLGTDVAVYEPDKFDLFKIPRLDTNDMPPKSDNYLNL